MNNFKGNLPNRRQIIGLAAAAMSLPTLAQTSSFPLRPVRIVVPLHNGRQQRRHCATAGSTTSGDLGTARGG